MMLANRHQLRSRRHAAHQRPGTIVRLERQDRFDFAVLRKRLRARQKNRAAIAIDAVAALLRRSQTLRDAMLVAQKEVGGIDSDDVAFSLLHFESPQHRSRK